MSCILNAGVDFDCDDGAGGVEEGSVLISQFENIETDWVATDGEITTLNQVASTYFYRFRIKNDNADWISTENHDPLMGTTFYETVFNAVIHKLSKEKNVLMKLLTGKPLVVIAKDMNGVNHIFGIERGAEKMGGTNQAASGKLMGDMNGYTLGITDRSKNLYTVSSTVMSGLSISTDIS